MCTNINWTPKQFTKGQSTSLSPFSTTLCTFRHQVISCSWSEVEKSIKTLPLWSSATRLSTMERQPLTALQWMSSNMLAMVTLSAVLMTSSLLSLDQDVKMIELMKGVNSIILTSISGSKFLISMLVDITTLVAHSRTDLFMSSVELHSQVANTATLLNATIHRTVLRTGLS